MAAILTGKIFTITGGTSGMGAATAKLLAQRSASAICIADKQTGLFENIKAELAKISLSTEVVTSDVDVSSSQAVSDWLDNVVDQFGGLDGCANVAGVPQPIGRRSQPTILEETDETWRKTISVNLDGIMYCTREQVRKMVELPKAPRAIVNVASLASMLHTPDAYAYGASKHACASFTSSVAKDVYKSGIRVNTVSPGATLTPMMSQFFTSDARDSGLIELGMELLQPSDIARAIVFLLTEDSDKITGVNLPVGTGAP